MYAAIAKKRTLRQFLCVGLMVALFPFLTSCYGHFPLTRAIYRMNGEAAQGLGEDNTGRKLIQTVVMWVLVIVPVYGVGVFADVVILNLIEFWTDSPVQIGAVQEKDGTRVALEPSADGREAVLTVTKDGQLLAEQHVIKVSDTRFEMRDASGRLSGTMLKTSDGSIQLTDAQGHVVRTLSAQDLAAMSSI